MRAFVACEHVQCPLRGLKPTMQTREEKEDHDDAGHAGPMRGACGVLGMMGTHHPQPSGATLGVLGGVGRR